MDVVVKFALAALGCASFAQPGLAQLACSQIGFESLLTVSETAGSGSDIFGDVCVVLTNSTTAFIGFTSFNSFRFIGDSMVDLQVNASSFTLGPIDTFFPGFASDGGSGNVNGYGVFNQTINNFDGAADAQFFVRFTLTNNSSTWASAADVLTPNAAGFDAAAQMICGVDSGCTATGLDGSPLTFFVAERAVVPEPRYYPLLLVGLIGLGGVILRLR